MSAPSVLDVTDMTDPEDVPVECQRCHKVIKAKDAKLVNILKPRAPNDPQSPHPTSAPPPVAAPKTDVVPNHRSVCLDCYHDAKNRQNVRRTLRQDSAVTGGANVEDIRVNVNAAQRGENVPVRKVSAQSALTPTPALVAPNPYPAYPAQYGQFYHPHAIPPGYPYPYAPGMFPAAQSSAHARVPGYTANHLQYRETRNAKIAEARLDPIPAPMPPPPPRASLASNAKIQITAGVAYLKNGASSKKPQILSNMKDTFTSIPVNSTCDELRAILIRKYSKSFRSHFGCEMVDAELSLRDITDGYVDMAYEQSENGTAPLAAYGVVVERKKGQKKVPARKSPTIVLCLTEQENDRLLEMKRDQEVRTLAHYAMRSAINVSMKQLEAQAPRRRLDQVHADEELLQPTEEPRPTKRRKPNPTSANPAPAHLISEPPASCPAPPPPLFQASRQPQTKPITATATPSSQMHHSTPSQSRNAHSESNPLFLPNQTTGEIPPKETTMSHNSRHLPTNSAVIPSARSNGGSTLHPSPSQSPHITQPSGTLPSSSHEDLLAEDDHDDALRNALGLQTRGQGQKEYAPFTWQQLQTLTQPAFELSEGTPLNCHLRWNDKHILGSPGSFKTCYLGQLTTRFARSTVVGAHSLFANPSNTLGQHIHGQAKVAVKRFHARQFQQGEALRLLPENEIPESQGEITTMVWARAIHDHGRSLMQRRAQTHPPPAPLANLRFVNFALAIANTERTQHFILEEVIDTSNTRFVKYINNGSALPCPGLNAAETEIADQLVCQQHITFNKTKGLLYVSDLQDPFLSAVQLGAGDLLTDAQVMTNASLGANLFAAGNVSAAHERFPIEHRCNRWCRWYGLVPFGEEPNTASKPYDPSHPNSELSRLESEVN
ncbi:hypothetical protein SISNIDRAFT_463590 [Sistotremastrum niveocremeum HHB9708]|uniref:Alpha-type protein kinase domain-containing protein n=1 Tax=Sistotremastrum niveocremeum HHB9708 TaxID=1314777 RepID=A0A164YEQ2_9AGAM|nr:hypothetical protein SISNIDRAFT_463590 [Sistotremastrum niveocremeum HHB9708]